MTDREAARILVVLTAAFPTYPVDDDTAALYVAALRGIDYRDAEDAAAGWVHTEARFPKVSELAYACKTVRVPYHVPLPPAPARAPKLTADEAKARFAEMRRLVRPQRKDHQ